MSRRSTDPVADTDGAEAPRRSGESASLDVLDRVALCAGLHVACLVLWVLERLPVSGRHGAVAVMRTGGPDGARRSTPPSPRGGAVRS